VFSKLHSKKTSRSKISSFFREGGQTVAPNKMPEQKVICEEARLGLYRIVVTIDSSWVAGGKHGWGRDLLTARENRVPSEKKGQKTAEARGWGNIFPDQSGSQESRVGDMKGGRAVSSGFLKGSIPLDIHLRLNAGGL